MTERLVVRILVGGALLLSVAAFALTPMPLDPRGNPDLPAPAFEQTALYRLEVALMVFYGDLLLVTPAFTGLIRGRLPIEISTRGARFVDEADQSVATDRVFIEETERATEALVEDVAAAKVDIERLQSRVHRDNRQPKVGSEV